MFDEVNGALADQTKAVISQDVDAIQAATEKQMELNALLQTQEDLFQSELKETFRVAGIRNTETRVTSLLEYLPVDSKYELTDLRDNLAAKVKESVDEREKLGKLLAFASDQTAHTLREIYAAGNRVGARYNQTGSQAASQVGTGMINRTA